ncbi:probable serine/threonine-protein kinase SIS8 [Rosa rugosa]|uniref:probable serine/threonine-protein kinase SIS8 n=1 Tax=Rosa rugosa TaxID=74645 RepID=UPI002B40B4EC|nr:probable serine/threonine-protein kinase SIS8 [Rosa rugosa]XP_061999605.1 probable serine/threonine-protein kinase SIS8 [Rosa rugosa]XP_061999611.1 probable serine/threonine-protein kinase SIS8 [Rosa rugosa]XP_061999617.1 probable serine/threonine-protein kinase SIS8 [Rosa rugosa]XP_061999624.1 probable serine/threonine-protein kinase SIS8 [Rosa rugosa]
MLVKGSYYTSTDDGAVNLIKIDSGIGSEYIIDLMGAPGTLIHAEVLCIIISLFDLCHLSSSYHKLCLLVLIPGSRCNQWP